MVGVGQEQPAKEYGDMIERFKKENFQKREASFRTGYLYEERSQGMMLYLSVKYYDCDMMTCIGVFKKNTPFKAIE